MIHFISISITSQSEERRSHGGLPNVFISKTLRDAILTTAIQAFERPFFGMEKCDSDPT